MSKLYSVIGTSSYDLLVTDPQGADLIAVPMEPGNGKVKRGTVIYRKANGLWAAAASGQISTSYQLAVINEEIDTGDSVEEGAVAENAAAYRAGCFKAGRVKLAADADVTEAHKVVLRLENIVFDQTDAAEEFDNGSYTITYVANNGADPAEDDVVDVKLAGASYTVLNNSDSKLGFTAPATKSFSKWNTKADGTGTDYAAAATYSTDADLTLHAVWA